MRLYVPIAVFFVAAFVMARPMFAEAILPYPELKKAITAAYEKREDLLRHSSGRAQLRLQRLRSPEDEERLRKRISEEFGWDSEKLSPLCGQSSWEVAWYTHDDKRRGDVVHRRSETLDKRQDLFLPSNKRIAIDPEKCIFYNVARNEAYINHASGRSSSPYSLFEDFDILQLYKWDAGTIPEFLDRHEAAGFLPEIVEKEAGGQKCVKLTFRVIVPPAGGVTREKLSTLWFAPAQGYSLIKANFDRTIQYPNGITQARNLAHLEAVYQESRDFPGVWLLSSLDYEDRCVEICEEILHVDIEAQKVGTSIPDETFTLEGMGVPAGTPLYDRRLAGQPVITKYVPGMKVGLDEITLTPGAGIKDDTPAAPSQGAHSCASENPKKPQE